MHESKQLKKLVEIFVGQLLAETTSSQFVKHPKNQALVASLKPVVLKFLQQKFDGVNIAKDTFTKFVNWFIKELITKQISADIISAVLSNWWANIGDWIISNHNGISSKFNTEAFTYEDAIEESKSWHEKIANKAKIKQGADGRVVVKLDNVPGFAGWTWVAMDKPNCETEGEVMGHCGNSGGQDPQNLLSLRDPTNVPHLTFINDKGALGEMKGTGNSKPSKKYHLPIIELLLSDEVATLRGGGYMPQMNFVLTDLTPEQQEMVRQAKPYIDKPADFEKNRTGLLGKEDKIRKNKIMAAATTNDEIKTAVREILLQNINLWDENKPSNLSKNTLDLGSKKQKMLQVFEYMLQYVYEKSRKTYDPAELFAWMDKAVVSFVEEIVVQDTETKNFYKDKPDPHIFNYLSKIGLLDAIVYQLYEKQPEILRAAPKRSRFGNYDDYIVSFKRYLMDRGYDLPPYKPKSNMISYEFLVKCGQEIAKQGRVLFA
jgi:hypothetical protein